MEPTIPKGQAQIFLKIMATTNIKDKRTETTSISK